MAHITSIGAAMFSDISVSMPAVAHPSTVLANINTAAEFALCFANKVAPTSSTARLGALGTNDPVILGTAVNFVSIGNVRSFPAMGTPPNIVKVPTYGQKTSQSIQGQADAPQLELDINFQADQWAKGTGAAYVAGDSVLGWGIGSGEQFVFRFALLMNQPTTLNAGAMAVENSLYYWVGKMEALLVTPSLTDAATAKLSLSIQSQFYGAYTGA